MGGQWEIRALGDGKSNRYMTVRKVDNKTVDRLMSINRKKTKSKMSLITPWTRPKELIRRTNGKTKITNLIQQGIGSLRVESTFQR